MTVSHRSAVAALSPVIAKPTGPTVLVLGATGFIGRALVQRLQADGTPLRALVRSLSGRAETLARQGLHLMQGDITATASVEAALGGIQHVVHLARSAGPTWDDYRHGDVEPTRRLAELCCTRGITLHYLSSIAIYDGDDANRTINETSAPSPASLRLNPYARAKVANEHLLAALQRQRGLQVVVYRPGIVIGPGGNPRHPGVGAWPTPTVCRPWGGGHHRLPFVLVDDCADALASALHTPPAAGASFNLVGDAGLTGNQYLDALQSLAGTVIRRAPWPAWRLFAQSVVKWGLGTLRGAAPRPGLPSYRYCDGLSCRAAYSNQQAKRQLGWAPVADPALLIERGIAAALVRAG